MASSPTKPKAAEKVKISSEMKIVKENDNKVRNYATCQIRNGLTLTDTDIVLLMLGRMAVGQDDANIWNTDSLGLQPTKKAILDLYKTKFDALLVSMRAKHQEFKKEEETSGTIYINKDPYGEMFTAAFEAWNLSPKTCTLSKETEEKENEQIQLYKILRAKPEKKKEEILNQKVALLEPSEAEVKSAAVIRSTDRFKAKAKPKAKPKTEVEAEGRKEPESEGKKETKAEAKKAPQIKEHDAHTKRIEIIKDLEEAEKRLFQDNKPNQDIFEFQVFVPGQVEKEAVIPISEFLTKIENDDGFITSIVENLQVLMTWKIGRYTDLLIKSLGNKTKLKLFIAEQKKAKKQEDIPTNERILEGEFKPKMYLLAQQACERKVKTITSELVRSNLFDAVSNPQNGIISLQGAARAPIRNQLIKTILSLSRNISQFKEGNNIILMGGSGSGKSKAASVIGYVYSKIGILANNTFRDVQPVSMMSSYHSGTTLLTARKILENLEGTMLIDEAYVFAPKCAKAQVNVSLPEKPKTGGAEEHGSEALNQIVTMIDELKGLIVVIMAGYEGAMRCLMAENEGVDRRFSNQTSLLNYENMDLTQMLVKKINSSIQAESTYVKLMVLTNDETTFLLNTISFLSKKNRDVFSKQAGAIDLLSQQFSMLLSGYDEKDPQWINMKDHISILTQMFNKFLLKSRIPFQLKITEQKMAAQVAPVPSYLVSAPPMAPQVNPKGGYQSQGTWSKFPKIRF